MTCHEIGPAIHVCTSPRMLVELRKLACDNCGCDRYHVVQHYEWYGPSGCCLRCGEEWADGEYLPRPFMRGWRKENIERARRAYRAERREGGR